MKPATILALPALALAAATPQIEERQLFGLPGLIVTLNTSCLLNITGILDCAPAINSSVPTTPLSALVGCSLDVTRQALVCVLEGLPVKN
ncbi:hypothetical protein CDV36_015610 [Fusarium kuroshium]|uniref:Hydrophobin n=1 Tax=Fusarium kuroshium TaxID=2010991 RepID=A0A3M2R8S5_9HYPO|nr:hypothetical protein CDV36_015610 [Fusarium kuroshium]